MRMTRNLNLLKGYHMTSQRRLLLEILQDSDDHIDAKELYQKANARDKSISQATVYRTLNLFKKLGVVDEHKLGMMRCKYELMSSPDHQHLVCRGCGKVIKIQNELFNKMVAAIQHDYEFRVTKAELCLEGYCPGCNEKKDG